MSSKILKSSKFEEYQYAKSVVDDAVLEAENIRKEAELYKREVEIKSKKILDAAELVRRESYKEGYDEGVRQSQSEYIEQTVNFVSQSLQYLKSIEEDIADIVISSVRNIINSYEPDEATYQYIKYYVNNIVTQKQIVLRVSPTASRVLNKRIAELNMNSNVHSLLVVPDIRLNSYDVVIETEFGTESVNIESKLTNLTNSFSLLMTGGEV